MAETASLTLAVTQDFPSGFRIDASLDVELPAGSMLVLFGPSAAGKTTILRQIAGLERPATGTIRFGGEIWCDTARQVWCPPQSRRIGLVFQEPTLFPHLTVRDNVLYGIKSTPDAHPTRIKSAAAGQRLGSGGAADGQRMRGGPAADEQRLGSGWTADEQRIGGGGATDGQRIDSGWAANDQRMDSGQVADEQRMSSGRATDAQRMDSGWATGGQWMGSGWASDAQRMAEIERMLGIGDLENRYPAALSGGEAQRVALARALAPDPRLMLLDEPFASLDGPTRLRLRRDLRALLQATGTPAILVTHDRTEALAMGDTIAVIIGGRVRQIGAVSDVFSRPANAEIAASLGIEAVLPARVIGSSGGVIEVSVGEVTLHVAEREPIAPGTGVYMCVRAEDVTLETRASGQASTRNHLAARIVSIASEGPIERVTLDCGFALDALITRRSREELGLVAGTEVTAAIKATSVHLVPRL